MDRRGVHFVLVMVLAPDQQPVGAGQNTHVLEIQPNYSEPDLKHSIFLDQLDGRNGYDLGLSRQPIIHVAPRTPTFFRELIGTFANSALNFLGFRGDWIIALENNQ